MVTDELKTKLSALGSQDTTERSANSRRALAMQQDLECGAYAKICGDDDMVDSDRPITGKDS